MCSTEFSFPMKDDLVSLVYGCDVDKVLPSFTEF